MGIGKNQGKSTSQTNTWIHFHPHKLTDHQFNMVRFQVLIFIS
jgi:hypothetical protein